jgi:hypothetical protein
MKSLIKRIPLWVIFLVGSCMGATAAIVFFSVGHILDTAMALVMTILLGIGTGTDLMEMRMKKALTKLAEESKTIPAPPI